MNLRELSDKLGLSQTTVSRALNGYPEVSDATRERVLAAAKKYNYLPSNRAKALATGRAMAIGHVIPISSKHEIVNPVFADFISGAGEIYAAHGYDLLLSTVSDTEQDKVYADLAMKRSVDGVVVHAPRLNDARIPLLKKVGLPFVVHGRSSDVKTDYCWLDVDNRRGFERATEFLIDLGHRRIALINGDEQLDFAARRREGYLWAIRKRGLRLDRSLMCSDEMTESYGYDTATRLLQGPNPPTAFLSASIIIAFGIRRAAGDLGLETPRDVSIITFDDDLSYFRNAGTEPIFTALRSSVRQAGRRSAEMLIRCIETGGKTPQREMLEAEFIIGRSTGPVPDRRRGHARRTG